MAIKMFTHSHDSWLCWDQAQAKCFSWKKERAFPVQKVQPLLGVNIAVGHTLLARQNIIRKHILV